ncbi:MAG: nucleotidyltransferase family protein [Hyphomonas sp.]|jgi:molybdenum cofactor cytidylyltransferase|nr:nucleotidyltransferase family protein [Hyphomonas sp.]
MNDAPRTGAIVLAAGRSSRFADGHKLLADIGGKPMIRRTLEAVADSAVESIVLVVSFKNHDAIMAAAGTGRWTGCINGLAEDGLASSLRSGAAVLPDHLDGVLVVLGDMPGVSPDLIAAILAKAAAFPGAIVYPLTPDGKQGHPVYWPADIVPEFWELTGDQGGKPLLRRHAHRIVTVPADDSATLDIDTVEDLAAFKAR